jgi:hypothetical protein
MCEQAVQYSQLDVVLFEQIQQDHRLLIFAVGRRLSGGGAKVEGEVEDETEESKNLQRLLEQDIVPVMEEKDLFVVRML